MAEEEEEALEEEGATVVVGASGEAGVSEEVTDLTLLGLPTAGASDHIPEDLESVTVLVDQFTEQVIRSAHDTDLEAIVLEAEDRCR